MHRFALWCALTLIGAGAGALAEDYQAGALKIGRPWARATPKGAKVGGGYFTIVNTGSTPDRLTSASLEEAGRVEVHEMRMEGTVMKMRPIESGLEIKPGETMTLKPGGYHLMFSDLKGPLTKGERVKGTLVFERAGTLPVEFEIESIAATAPGGGHDHAKP